MQSANRILSYEDQMIIVIIMAEFAVFPNGRPAARARLLNCRSRYDGALPWDYLNEAGIEWPLFNGSVCVSAPVRNSSH